MAVLCRTLEIVHHRLCYGCADCSPRQAYRVIPPTLTFKCLQYGHSCVAHKDRKGGMPQLKAMHVCLTASIKPSPGENRRHGATSQHWRTNTLLYVHPQNLQRKLCWFVALLLVGKWHHFFLTFMSLIPYSTRVPVGLTNFLVEKPRSFISEHHACQYVCFPFSITSFGHVWPTKFVFLSPTLEPARDTSRAGGRGKSTFLMALEQIHGAFYSFVCLSSQ